MRTKKHPPPRGSLREKFCIGIAGVPHKTTAVICTLMGKQVSVGSCRGGLDPEKPELTLAVVLSVIDNSLHVAARTIGYSDIACVVINIPGDMDEWYVRAFIAELKSLDARLEHVRIVVLSDIQSEVHRIARGGPGLIINSGPQDTCFGLNSHGEVDWVETPGFGDRLAWEAMNLVVTTARPVDGYELLVRKFLDNFHVSEPADLEDILGFYDPIERQTVKGEIFSIIAEEAVVTNPVALELCNETISHYADIARGIIYSLDLRQDSFPISLRGGLFEVDPIFRRLYQPVARDLAKNAYIAEPLSAVGSNEAQVAVELVAADAR